MSHDMRLSLFSLWFSLKSGPKKLCQNVNVLAQFVDSSEILKRNFLVRAREIEYKVAG